MKNSKWLIAFLALMAFCQSAKADGTSPTAQITVNVTILAAPCEINNNQNINVDFGDEVAVTDVALGLIAKDISYTLDCRNANTAKTLKMMIRGAGADFDANVLQTSVTDLGVKIEADGVDFPLNSDLALASSDAKPALKAVLVQKPGARLQTGAFTAGATMMVDYQ